MSTQVSFQFSRLSTRLLHRIASPRRSDRNCKSINLLIPQITSEIAPIQHRASLLHHHIRWHSSKREALSTYAALQEDDDDYDYNKERFEIEKPFESEEVFDPVSSTLIENAPIIKEEEKKEILRQIRRNINETIDNILEKKPLLKNAWMKEMARISKNQLKLKVSPNNVPEGSNRAAEGGTLTESLDVYSLHGEKDELIEKNVKVDFESSIPEQVNLMGLLEDYPDESNISESEAAKSLMDLLDDDSNEDSNPLYIDESFVEEPNNPSADDENHMIIHHSQYASAEEFSMTETNDLMIDSDFSDETKTMLLNEENENRDYQHVISRGLALLSALKEEHWKDIYGDDDFDDEDESEDLSVVEGRVEENDAYDDDNVDDLILSNNDINSIQNSNKNFYDILPKMEHLLQNAFSEQLQLSTKDYNLILMMLTSTSLYESHDTISMISEIYSHIKMSDEKLADGITYAIVVLALSRKGDTPYDTTKVIHDMMEHSICLNNPEALIQASQCLEKYKEVSQAEQLIRCVMNTSKGERPAIPVEAVLPLLRLYKAKRMEHEAMDMVDDYIKEVGYGYDLNDLFWTLTRWPNTNQRGEREDIRTFQSFLFNQLKRFEQETTSEARPNNSVWTSFIMQLAKCAPKGRQSKETQLIQEILWLLMKRDQRYFPRERALKCGLEIAAIQGDGNLSVELLKRSLSPPQYSSDLLAKDEQDGNDINLVRPRVPSQAFLLSMQTCSASKNLDAIKSLLLLVEDRILDIPEIVTRQLMNQAIRGFVDSTEFFEARKLLNRMADIQLVPSDETLGAVIHGLAMNRKAKEALVLFEELKNGTFGDIIKPGILCYNAKILALLQLKKWEEVISLHRELKDINLPASSIAFQGLILASTRIGNTLGVVQVIEESIKQNNVKLNRECFRQSVKCLFPDLLNGNESLSIPDMRLELRQRVDAKINGTVGKAYLGLSRALRIAEVEDKREESMSLPRKKIEYRQQDAWNKVHQALIHLHRLAPCKEENKEL